MQIYSLQPVLIIFTRGAISILFKLNHYLWNVTATRSLCKYRVKTGQKCQDEL